MIILKADCSGSRLTRLVGWIGLVSTVSPVGVLISILMVKSIVDRSRTQNHLGLDHRNSRLLQFDDFIVDEGHPVSLVMHNEFGLRIVFGHSLLYSSEFPCDQPCRL